MPKSKIFLPDVNFWIALVSMRHVHNALVIGWLERNPGASLAFCRVTQMGLFRLLTNARVMGNDVLGSTEAWRTYDEIRGDMRVRFLPEPAGLEAAWKRLSEGAQASAWTDAYLMAFAQTADLQIVTMDRGFGRFGDEGTVILET